MDRQVLNKAWLLMNLERPVSGPTYSDEHIERWASIYLANPVLRLIGVPFAIFLATPGAWLQYVATPVRAAEAAIREFELAEGHGENGRLVQKLRHHARKRSRADFAPLRDA